ncbi:MAG TPA: acyl-CoA dehydrogenase family protein [Burkholderiales bacterium]|nr:acyl-CoA dehydrogenase family protein [Burkholderiales bacterium]
MQALSAEERAFRAEVRRFVEDNLPEAIRRKVMNGQKILAEEMRAWHRILDARGWVAPAWDPQWGGTGWDPVQLHAFREESQLAFAPAPQTFNINLVGPILIAFGTEAQKQAFLPGLRSLDLWFCQGFSEPGAGSDLAALRTSAVRDGDAYVINGQKIWTTLAHWANWMFALVRTSSAGRKQDGITYLLIDMATPGITVRPLITIDRDHHVNEVFFDNVRVPVANRIGEENKAWEYAKYLLTHERIGGARTGIPMARIRRAKQIAADVMVEGRPLLEQRQFREKLAELEVELKALEISYMRLLTQMMSNPLVGADPKSSILKMRGSELNQRTAELLVEIAGPDSVPYQEGRLDGTTLEPPLVPEWAATTMQVYFLDRATTIFAGSSEVQRNILAKATLGL